MKKITAVLFAFLMLVSLCGCGKTEEARTTVEIDTGIPDTVMLIEDNLMLDEYAPVGDNREQYVNRDGNNVYYWRRDGEGNTEMEKFHSYLPDGRLHQELTKFYRDGNVFEIRMQQFEFTEGSREAVATIWEYTIARGLQTDTVNCTMSTKTSELYCNSWQADPLEIRGLVEYRYGCQIGYIEFLASVQIEEE